MPEGPLDPFPRIDRWPPLVWTCLPCQTFNCRECRGAEIVCECFRGGVYGCLRPMLGEDRP